jgi:hypothetical protein
LISEYSRINTWPIHIFPRYEAHMLPIEFLINNNLGPHKRQRILILC